MNDAFLSIAVLHYMTAISQKGTAFVQNIAKLALNKMSSNTHQLQAPA